MLAYTILRIFMDLLNPLLKNRLESKLSILNSYRPLPPVIVDKLRTQFAVEMTYNSNAIEGNSLNLKETAWVIQDGLTIKGKPLKDHLEARDHYDALTYLYELIEHDTHQTVSEVLIRSLHRLVVRETEKKEAGKYRDGNVMITGADHIPPDMVEVPGLMRSLMRWIASNQSKLNSIELAAITHHKLVNIHPFFDGNGRTARLVMNLLLLQQGYPLVIILKNDRLKYYRALAAADKGNYQSFVRFVAQAVERSLNVYLKAIAPPRKTNDKYFLLSELAKSLPYSTKYLNLLARMGKIEAHKEKRNWTTTLSAIERYMRDRQRQRKNT